MIWLTVDGGKTHLFTNDRRKGRAAEEWVTPVCSRSIRVGRLIDARESSPSCERCAVLADRAELVRS